MRFAPLQAADGDRLVSGRHHAPHEVLGRRDRADESLVRVWLPGATDVRFEDGPSLVATSHDHAGLCEWRGKKGLVPRHYRLVWRDIHGNTRSAFDPYAYDAKIGEQDVYLFNEGRHRRLYEVLGAQPCAIDGMPGVRFVVWAPNAERVSVVGDWNEWNGLCHPLGVLGGSGLWSVFVPELPAGACYKLEVRNRYSGEVLLKADPFARAFERRPKSASRIVGESRHVWGDAAWLESRRTFDAPACPVSIYEVHLGSWQRAPDGGFLHYSELAERLAAHARTLGFTHVELLPITEHPFDGSWGYQTLGYFAPSSRFGEPDDFRAFVDVLHQQGIGVILDWVPAHFPRDHHGLARFDGSALYEHEDPRLGRHRDWDTAIFNYGRSEVRGFLIASALYWLHEFHLDGLRVDAVASMLYLDYSRAPGDWVPNRHGGRENLEAIELLRELNDVVRDESPGVFVCAEESTSWPQVTGPTASGGLGFTFKWNMGWMHDSLAYMHHDPIHRAFHHQRLTFGMVYAYSERFILPFSHDEVVHGKASMLGKMPGDDWQKFANLRLLYTYLWTYPGKKLLFMGDEIGQWREWNHDRALDWDLLAHAPHRGLQDLVRDLNALYRTEAAFTVDHEPAGFQWLDCEDKARSVIAYLRRGGGTEVVVVLNFTPMPRTRYRIGVPAPGRYVERLNSDSAYYGGSNLGNLGGCDAIAVPIMGQPWSVVLTLPPLAGLVLAIDTTL